MPELKGSFKKPSDFFNYTARDSAEFERERSNKLNPGDSIADAELKNSENILWCSTGDYGNLVTTKPNTTITATGDVTFKQANISQDIKVNGIRFLEAVQVEAGATAIFNNCIFTQPTVISGNAHFIGCLFQGAVSNTGTSYILGCSNKSGAAHVGIPAGNIFGETT